MQSFISAQAQESKDPRVEVASRAADAALKRLKSTLIAKIQEGTEPAEAIPLCHVSAQPMTIEEVSGQVLDVRRATLKARNPANKAKPDEKKILKQWAKLVKKGKTLPVYTSAVIETDFHYYRPLKVEAACLTCHGSAESIPVSVRAKLNQLYPKDEATGYKVGDLRGMIHVVVR